MGGPVEFIGCEQFRASALIIFFKTHLQGYMISMAARWILCPVCGGLRYRTHARDQIAIITTTTPLVLTLQHHEGYGVPSQTSSCLENLKCAS